MALKHSDDLSLRKRILLLLLIILVGMVSLEATARVFLGGKKIEPVVPRSIGQFDELLGWSLKPNSREISNRTGSRVEYRINSKGLRDNETGYEKPQDIFRIILLGDSYAFGYGVPIEKHFSTLIEGYFKDVEVVNMGVSGYGIDQEYLLLQLEGYKYQPDLVMVYVPHYKDHRHMHIERWGKGKPRFLLKGGKLMLTNSPVPNPEDLQDPGLLRSISHWLFTHSRVYQILRNGLVKMMRPQASPTPGGAEEQFQRDTKNIQDESFKKELFDLGESLIFAMHDKSIEMGAAFVLMTRIKELHLAALERGVFSLHVTRAVYNTKFSLGDKLNHINEPGNGVLAWEIAKFLQSNHLIPAMHLRD